MLYAECILIAEGSTVKQWHRDQIDQGPTTFYLFSHTWDYLIQANDLREQINTRYYSSNAEAYESKPDLL